MNGVTRTNSRNIPVPLVRKDHLLRLGTLDPGSHRLRPPMRGANEIAAEKVQGKARTTHWRDANGIADNIQFLQHFANETMNNAVRTAGAIMKGQLRQALGSAKYSLHIFRPPSDIPVQRCA